MKGICFTWSRGRLISPSLPVGDDWYLKLGSQKRPTGRNLGGNRLVRRSGTASRGTALLVFSLRMRNFVTYHKEEITSTLLYIYRSYYLLKSSWVDERDLSHMVKGPTYLSLPACRWRLVSETCMTHKSDPRAEISGEIVWYDALAPRPEVLLFSYLVCACAVLLELKFLPYAW